jgi:hypothetical protein
MAAARVSATAVSASPAAAARVKSPLVEAAHQDDARRYVATPRRHGQQKERAEPRHELDCRQSREHAHGRRLPHRQSRWSLGVDQAFPGSAAHGCKVTSHTLSRGNDLTTLSSAPPDGIEPLGHTAGRSLSVFG